MKKLKKLAAVLLSLVMTAMLAIPALAAGEYSITISNEKSGHTYEAYQIFAGDVSRMRRRRAMRKVQSSRISPGVMA